MRNTVYLQLSRVNIPGMDTVVSAAGVYRVRLIKENKIINKNHTTNIIQLL
jgi:hypothetical protein